MCCTGSAIARLVAKLRGYGCKILSRNYPSSRGLSWSVILSLFFLLQWRRRGSSAKMVRIVWRKKKKMGKVTTRRKISSAKSICFPDCSQTCTSDILTQLCSRVLKVEMSRGSGDLYSRFASRVREQFIIFAIGMVPSFGLCDSSSRMPWRSAYTEIISARKKM